MIAGVSSQLQGLPRWAKMLIVFVVLSFIAVYIGGVALIYLARQATLRCLEPAQILRVSKRIAKFPEPLPAGYAFVFGLHLGPLSIVTIEHQPDKQAITVAAEQRTEVGDAEALLKQSYEAGVNLPTAGLPTYARFKSSKGNGETEIAGQKMPYRVGLLEDSSGRDQEGFIGSIAVKQAKRNILIFGLQPDGKPYKLEETLCFLKSLTGF